jgi:hypothetical protein
VQGALGAAVEERRKVGAWPYAAKRGGSSGTAVHPVHFAAAFRRFHGCSAGEYLRRLRLQYARGKLADPEVPLLAAGGRWSAATAAPVRLQCQPGQQHSYFDPTSDSRIIVASASADSSFSWSNPLSIPVRSASVRFWPSFHFPERRAIGISTPTIAPSILET